VTALAPDLNAKAKIDREGAPDVTLFIHPPYSFHCATTMAHISKAALRRLSVVAQCNCPKLIPSAVRTIPSAYRNFSGSSDRRTDGVFRELTAQRVRTPWIEALRKQQAEGKDPSAASEHAAVPKDRQLTPKHMDDSYSSIVLPLANDPWLLDTYLNASGHIRLGTIFMDLDALSGVIAYKHTGDDVTTVTASCDRIVIQHPLTEICDLELSGRVTYATGRSSMEISMQVAKAPKEGEKVKKEDVLIHCTFTMVSLDPNTKKYEE
jgi:acyl-coenzyme A thioesterase 9